MTEENNNNPTPQEAGALSAAFRKNLSVELRRQNDGREGTWADVRGAFSLVTLLGGGLGFCETLIGGLLVFKDPMAAALSYGLPIGAVAMPLMLLALNAGIAAKKTMVEMKDFLPPPPSGP